MSRRRIFEGVRRRPVGRRRFLLAADVLEERTLLSYVVPSQIRHAYGVDQITFTGPGGTAIQGDGAGQTIAILGLGNDPTILPDLQQFDRTFNLPDPPSFQQINNLKVGVDPSGIEETSIDVEWAHAIAPAANILLFDFSPAGGLVNSSTSLVDEVQYVTQNYHSVSVVSISYGLGEAYLSQNNWNLQSYDTVFQAPGVTFLVAAGDNGAYGDYRADGDEKVTVEDAAASPDVVAVGGTTLQNLDAAGDYPGTGANGEVAWGNGTNSGSQAGGGGGISTFEPEPTWQQKVVPTSIDPTRGRAVPDVAWDANPATGFFVFYSTPDENGNVGWTVQGGTSAAAPQWAGLIAIADQERVQGNGGTPLTGYDQTLPALYSLPSSDYHDIVIGNNGYPAGPGYDLDTGLGSPVANLLVPALAAYKSQLVVTAQPPPTVTAGQGFGLTIKVEDGFGDVVTSYNGSVTIALANNPGGGTLGGTLTVAAVNGVATFSGLALNNLGTAYTLKVTASGLSSASTTAITVANPPQIQSATVVFTQKTNPKTHKKIGKPVMTGYQFTFNTAMNPATTGSSANYQVQTYAYVSVKVGKKFQKKLELQPPIGITVNYQPSSDAVELLTGKQAFKYGGQITLIGTGISSAGGALLGNNVLYSISKGGRSITPLG